MFPVHMKYNGNTPPESVPHYIVAKNGIFLKKANAWMEATVPVKQIAVLEEQAIGIKLKCPPISVSVLTRAWKFFQAVYKKQQTESALLLHYSETLGWEISIPDQTAVFAHVDYKMHDRLDGYSFMGTMHSHSSMSAFHSGTDVSDEAQVDGIHITFGNLNEEDKFSLDPEVVINGTRFGLPISHLEGVSQVVLPTSVSAAVFSRATSAKYTITVPEDMVTWQTPEEWLEKVQKPAPSVIPPYIRTNQWQMRPTLSYIIENPIETLIANTAPVQKTGDKKGDGSSC